MRATDIRTIRNIADKYGLVWHVQGDGWVINGVQQPYWFGRNSGEKAVLVDYMARNGKGSMSATDYDTVYACQQQMLGRLAAA